LDVVCSLYAQLFHLVIQRRSDQPETSCRSVGAANLALRFAQDTKNVLSLGRLEGRILRGGWFFGHDEFTERSAQNRSFGKDDGPFDEVLQFADISGPVPACEGPHRFVG